jgi:hypothetical protein
VGCGGGVLYGRDRCGGGGTRRRRWCLGLGLVAARGKRPALIPCFFLWSDTCSLGPSVACYIGREKPSTWPYKRGMCTIGVLLRTLYTYNITYSNSLQNTPYMYNITYSNSLHDTTSPPSSDQLHGSCCSRTGQKTRQRMHRRVELPCIWIRRWYSLRTCLLLGYLRG